MSKDALFVGVYPTGLVYADKRREKDGDYKRCAYLNYRTLVLDIAADCSADLLDAIKADAAKVQARRGEPYALSTCGEENRRKGDLSGCIILGDAMNSLRVSVTDTSGNISGTRLTVPPGKDALTAANEYAYSHCIPPRELRIEGFKAPLVPPMKAST